jgi:hypothetical protein
MSETPLNQDQNPDEIDLKDLIIPIWNARKQILTVALIFAVLGGVLGFLIPATYTATSSFLPQTSQKNGSNNNLGGLSALAGINLNSPLAEEDIPTSMYPIVLGSEPFRKKILDSKIFVNGDSLTYRNYLKNQPPSALGVIQEFSIGLPNKILDYFSNKGDNNKPIISEVAGLKPLSDEEYSLQKSLVGKINFGNDIEGFVAIKVIENNPFVAVQIALITQTLLQDWISEFKIKKAKNNYSFISKQFETKERDFFSKQEELASYIDRNQNVLSATYSTRLSRLQAEFNLINTVYSQLAQQKEQAAIQLIMDTPTFTIIDPIKFPREKSSPNRKMYVFLGFLIGLFSASIWVFLKKPILLFYSVLRQSQ